MIHHSTTYAFIIHRNRKNAALDGIPDKGVEASEYSLQDRGLNERISSGENNSIYLA